MPDVAGGACADTAIARVMISAGTSTGRSPLGDMVGLHALTRPAGSVEFFPLGSFGLGNQKADVLSGNRLGEAGKAASDGRVQKLCSSRQAMCHTLRSALPQRQVKTDLGAPRPRTDYPIGTRAPKCGVVLIVGSRTVEDSARVTD